MLKWKGLTGFLRWTIGRTTHTALIIASQDLELGKLVLRGGQIRPYDSVRWLRIPISGRVCAVSVRC